MLESHASHAFSLSLPAMIETDNPCDGMEDRQCFALVRCKLGGNVMDSNIPEVFSCSELCPHFFGTQLL